MRHLSSSIGRIAFIFSIAIVLAIFPYLEHASAHAYSAGYNTLTLTKEQTEMAFSIDELSVIELTDGDIDDNKMLDETEFAEVKDNLLDILQQSITLKIGNEEQSWTEVESIVLNRQGGASKAVLKAVYPPVSATQSISLTDNLYKEDSKTNYVDLLTVNYGAQKSTSALSADNRTWTLQLMDAEYSGLPQNLDQLTETPSTEEPVANPEQAESRNSAMSGAFSFFQLGMNHILGGYDHLLFLFSLLIARQTFKQYASMITAFTIAHSLTLTLTVLGIIHLSPRIIEPGIALSICYVAIDNIVRKQVSYRWLLTFLFGLIHGMGFADILNEMDIPRNELAIDLTSFNLGIEAVQLVIVATLVPLLYQFHRNKHARKVVLAGSGVALVLGAAWLFERIFAA
ncbi:HupE/UreJ family protein [Cohnella lupini]|uniref:Hydrogenase/urease accessory protein HupE n=1 Tax=Cohnella lupini TaxID=1294267 RepID=A0A3D9IV48_9BACL|nr:HupE/UreJ family protein [Cohnella lupini]RED65658.1 hydrogenase/urease accessory protein HupE [Cohnella lupini]